jgi:hypothetical protein
VGVLCCASFLVLMGRAAVLVAALVGLSVSGGVRPAGEAIELGTRKSSRFMRSGAGPLVSSIDLYICAMPLEAGG